jgi:hypothetical protein
MIIIKGKMVFDNLTFFPPKIFLLRKIFLFQNTKKRFGGKKINLAKKVGSGRYIIKQDFSFSSSTVYSDASNLDHFPLFVQKFSLGIQKLPKS